MARRALSRRLAVLGPALAIAVASVALPLPAGAASPSPRQVLRGTLVEFAAGRQHSLGAARTRTDHGLLEAAVTVELSRSADSAALAGLAATGFEVRGFAGTAVEGYASGRALRGLSADPTVQTVTLIVPPSTTAQVSPAAAIFNVPAWSAAGFTGKGVKVGILDLGFAGLASHIGTDVPADVVARCYGDLGVVSANLADCQDGGETHGTAVAEAIAGLAPDVTLYVADPQSPVELAQTVAWMTASGVRIISSSVVWFLEGPGDGSSPYRSSIYSVVDQAISGGAMWVNSAGNYGHQAWSGPWTDPDGNGLLNWSGGPEQNTIQLHASDNITAEIRWSSPLTDYALELTLGGQVVASSDDRQALTRDPAEAIDFTAPTTGTYGIQVRRVSGPSDQSIRLLAASSFDSDLGIFVTQGSLPAPVDSTNPGLVAVGAVRYTSPSVIEPYSSQGPTTAGRITPELVAADCAPTVTIPDFCGTSESAPFVAGAAALVLQSNPSLTPASLAAWLRSHATPIGTPTPNSVYGAGLLNLGPIPAAVVPAAVGFASPPASGVAGGPLAGSPVVEVLDSQGARLTAGSGATATIQLAIAGNASAATLTCDGGLTRQASAGLAVFPACQIDLPGTYELVASIQSLPGATSPASPATSPDFTVRAAGTPPELSLSSSVSKLTYPAAAVLSVASSLPDGANRPVELQQSSDRAIWRTIGTTTTDAGGAAAVSFAPRTTGFVRALFQPDTARPIEASEALAVSVAQRIGLTASIPSGRTLARGTAVTLTGAAAPAGSGVARPRVKFALYVRVGTAWRLSRTLFANAGSDGRARIVVRLTAGRWWIRAQAQPTTTDAGSVWATGVRYLVL